MSTEFIPDPEPLFVGTSSAVSASQINKELNFTYTIPAVQWTSITNTTGNYWKITFTGNDFGAAGLTATSGNSIYFSNGSQFLCQDAWTSGSPPELSIGFTATAGWTPPSPLIAGIGQPGAANSQLSFGSSTVRTFLGRSSGSVSLSSARGKPDLSYFLSGFVPSNAYFGSWQGLNIYVDSSNNLYFSGYNGSSLAQGMLRFSSNGALLYRPLYSSPTGYGSQKLAVDSANNKMYMTMDDSSSRASAGFATFNISGTQAIQTDAKTMSMSYSYTCMAVDSAGNLFLVCASQASTSTSYVLVFKYNSAGTLVWTYRYDATSKLSVYGCAVDSAGNLYLAGTEFTSPTYSAHLIKLDSGGAVAWDKKITDNGTLQGIPNSFYSVTVSGTTVYTGGTGVNAANPASNLCVFAFDTSGNYLASRGVNGVPTGASSPSLSADSSGVYVTASGLGGGMILKLNTNLIPLWANQIRQTGGGWSTGGINVGGTAPMPNGGLAISGSYYASSGSSWRPLVGVLPTDGSLNSGTSLSLGSATLTYTALSGLNTNPISSGFSVGNGSTTRSSNSTTPSTVAYTTGTITGSSYGPTRLQ